MGASLSAEEKAFTQAAWAELLELAVQEQLRQATLACDTSSSPTEVPESPAQTNDATASAASAAASVAYNGASMLVGVASSSLHHATSKAAGVHSGTSGDQNQFCLSQKEWEALLCLCDEVSSAAAASASSLLDGVTELALKRQQQNRDEHDHQPVLLRSPFVGVCCHLIAAVEGVVDWEVAARRWEKAGRLLEGHASSTTSTVSRQPLVLGIAAAVAAKRMHDMLSVEELEQETPRIAKCGNDLADLAANSDVKYRPAVSFLVNLMISLLQEVYVKTLLRLNSHDVDEMFNGLRGVVDFAEDALSVFASSSVKKGITCTQRLQRRLADLTLEADVRTMQLAKSVQRKERRTPNIDGSVAENVDLLSWDTFGNSYVGQKHVVDEVRKYFYSRQLGLADDNKPAVLLLFGPSGHGKTELAKSLAKVLHNDLNPEASGKLVVLHLPSLCTKESIYSLVDPPAAHVGEGLLLQAVRQEKDAVVVLDEFEKGAADAVQNLWLSAFQRGGMLRSLKDSTRSASTSKIVFVLTCNLCAAEMKADRENYQNTSSEEQQDLRTAYIAMCKQKIAKEFGDPFLNRIDLILPFVPYSFEERCQFASIQIDRLCEGQRTNGRDVLVGQSFIRHVAGSLDNFHSAKKCTDLLVDDVANLAMMPAAEEPSDKRQRRWIFFSSVPSLASPAQPTINSFNSITCKKGTKHDLDVGCTIEGMLKDCENETEKQEGTDIVAADAGGGEPDVEIAEHVPSTTRPEKNEPAPSTSTTPEVSSSPAAPVTPVATGTGGGSSSSKSHLQQSKETSAGDTVNEEQTELETELELERVVDVEKQTEKVVETDREVELQKELEATKEKLLDAEKEIVTLKETIKELEQLLGYAMLTIVSLCCVLLLFVEFQTLVLFTAALCVLLSMIPNLVKMGLRALYRMLGPGGCAALGGLVFAALVARQNGVLGRTGCPE